MFTEWMYGMGEEAYVCASSTTKFEYYDRDVINDYIYTYPMFF